MGNLDCFAARFVKRLAFFSLSLTAYLLTRSRRRGSFLPAFWRCFFSILVGVGGWVFIYRSLLLEGRCAFVCWRARARALASGCTVACRAHGACHAPETGGAWLTMALKPTTCSSIFAHAHRGRGKCCSSTRKSAGPAGRRPLREARAARAAGASAAGRFKQMARSAYLAAGVL